MTGGFTRGRERGRGRSCVTTPHLTPIPALFRVPRACCATWGGCTPPECTRRYAVRISYPRKRAFLRQSPVACAHGPLADPDTYCLRRHAQRVMVVEKSEALERIVPRFRVEQLWREHYPFFQKL